MVHCRASFLLLALVLFACNSSSLDVPRSFIRRNSDDSTQTLEKLVQTTEFNAKRSLQVAKKPIVPNSTKSAVKSNATTPTEEDQIGPVLTEILAQIVELIVQNLSSFLIDFLIGLIGGRTDANSGLLSNTSNSTSINDALSELTKNLANRTANVATTTEDQIGGPIIQEILSQIVGIIVDAIANFIIDFISGLLTGASLEADSTTGSPRALVNATTLSNNITSNVSLPINELTSGNGTVTEEQLVESVAPVVIEFVVTAVSDAVINSINETIGSELISDFLSSLIANATDPLIDFLINDVLGLAVSDESTLGSLNTTALNTAIDDLGNALSNASASGAVSADTIDVILAEALPAIIEAVIVIFAEAIAGVIIDLLFGTSENSNRRQLTSLSTNGRSLANLTSTTEDQTAGPIADVLIQFIGSIIFAIGDIFYGLLNGILSGRTERRSLKSASNRSLVNTTSSTEDQIGGPILQEILSQIVGIIVDAIANFIIDFIGGILTGESLVSTTGGQGTLVNTTAPSKDSNRRRLSSLITDGRSLANVTSITEDQVAGPIITEVLIQIVGVIVFAIGDFILDLILGIISGTAGRRNLKSTANQSVTNATATTEDQIGGPIIQEILSQIVGIIVDAIANFIIDFISGLLTGASLEADSTTGGPGALVNTTVLSNDITANITVSIKELSSTNETVTEEQLVEAVLPAVIVIVVPAVSDALINAINATVGSDLISDFLISAVTNATNPIIKFLLNGVSGNVVAEESTILGPVNTTSFNTAVDDLGSALVVASNTGTVSADTIEQILLEALPAIIEAIIVIFAEAIANVINGLIFGLAQILPFFRTRRSLQATSSNTTDLEEDQILESIIALIVNALVSTLITIFLELLFGSGDGTAREEILNDLQSTLSNITTTLETVNSDETTVVSKVMDAARNEPVKKLRGFLGGL